MNFKTKKNKKLGGNEGFICGYCQERVKLSENIGTHHRNHCPFCLWSKHVDLEKSGDRMADCKNPMEPIGLTFKQEGKDKYGKIKQGELMIIHRCEKCGKISLNRVAGDDSGEEILGLLETAVYIKLSGINFLSLKDQKEVKKQLFGSKI